MLLALIIIFVYYSTVSSLDTFRIIILILLLGIIVGIHGLSHLGLEYVYGYSPYRMIFGDKNHACNCPYCPMMRQYFKKKAEEGFQCPMMSGQECPMMRSTTCALRGV
jgi:hypothetical protein